jgi:uncharacterized membrane protein YsdA (DUF1294 family)/cold shock CspA family protein
MPDIPMRVKGHLKSWNDERGFGFIKRSEGGKDIFVHLTAFPRGGNRPKVGEALTFEIEIGPNGKPRACSVQHLVPDHAPKLNRSELSATWTLPRILVTPVFASVWLSVASRWPVSPYALIVYIGLSLFTFLTYAIDKSAAIHGSWRTSENTLHLLGLAGGWPGALLAQQLLRHKCSKPSFVAAFWVTVALNMTGFVAWHAGLIRALQR